jgi:catecholate siderophore receptor
MSRESRKRRRKRHHIKQHQSPVRNRRRPCWIFTTAFVASAALSAGLSTKVYAGTMPVPSETGTWAAQAQGNRRTAGDQPAQRFDIASGPLSAVLPVFEKAAGIKVTLGVDSIGLITSPGVSGVFTPQDALARLLEGTNVAVRFTAPGAATLEFRLTAESVDVTAPAPAVVVSSPKYTQPLREVPQTIEVIPQAVMQAQGVTTLSEALRNVPGITMQAGEGGGASNTSGDMFNMRGFNAANSLFVDGVRDDGLVSRDVFNLEQVEVFLGPTGSDVGRGTAAGYVNMETKTPHLASAYSGQIGFGSADQKRMTLDLGAPLSRQRDSWLSKSAFRLNTLLQDSGVPGRQIVNNESRAVAPSLALGLDTTTRVILAAQFLKQDNQPDYGVPGAAWAAEPLAPTTVRATRPVDQSNYFGSVGYDYDRATQQSYTGRVEHDIRSNLTFRNQARYNRAYRDAVITSIGNPAAFDSNTNLVTLSRQGNQRENKVFSNQTSLVDKFATGTLRHAATIGLEYTFEQQWAPTLAGVGTRGPVSIYAPNPDDPVAAYNPIRTGAYSEGWTNTIAAYAFDSVDLGRKWQATGGLRFERFDTEFRAVDATSTTTTNQGAKDGVVSGKAGLLYKAAENGNFYVSYGSVVTPPGTANFTLSAQANNQNNPNVEPQTSTNLEVGSKWDFAQGRLSINGALFHTQNKNVIFTVDATAVPPIYNQDDAQRVNGVSLGAAGRITENWQVLGSFAYLDAITESQGPTNGNRMTLTPKFSGSVWTTYRLPVRLTIGGGLRTTDDVFINTANTIHSPGYHLIDALAEYEINAHLSLRLNIYNLTDEVYIRNVNNNGGRYNPGNPRSAMLSLPFKF